MSDPTSQDPRYEEAKAHVAQVRELYGHVSAYVVVNAGLFTIDMLTEGGTWFYWPLLGWGIGLVAHTATVFGPGRRLGSEWERRKIDEYVSRRR